MFESNVSIFCCLCLNPWLALAIDSDISHYTRLDAEVEGLCRKAQWGGGCVDRWTGPSITLSLSYLLYHPQQHKINGRQRWPIVMNAAGDIFVMGECDVEIMLS